MNRILPSGARLEIVEELDSTSLEAKRRIAAGETGPLWICARRQTAGYGRRGSSWMQQEGDLAATLAFAPGAPADRLPQISFVAALALADAIDDLAPGARVRLKWPNDVLVNGAKIAGVLLELETGPDGRAMVCLGIGVNIVSAPTGLDYAATRLADVASGRGPPPSAERLLEKFDAALARRLRQWTGQGFEATRADWLARAAGLGAEARVRVAEEDFFGRIAGIAADGALLLDRPDGRMSVAAGSLFISQPDP